MRLTLATVKPFLPGTGKSVRIKMIAAGYRIDDPRQLSRYLCTAAAAKAGIQVACQVVEETGLGHKQKANLYEAIEGWVLTRKPKKVVIKAPTQEELDRVVKLDERQEMSGIEWLDGHKRSYAGLPMHWRSAGEEPLWMTEDCSTGSNSDNYRS